MEGSWENAAAIWSSESRQVRDIVYAVIGNLCFTLLGWVYVYDCKSDNSQLASLFYDRMQNTTTGNDALDGLLNGFICLSFVAAISFVVLGFALYDFRRLIHLWLGGSCVLILFSIAFAFFQHLFEKLDVNNHFLLFFITIVYGTFGCLAFFTEMLPLWVHQLYVTTNCSFVSMFYLRTLPFHTVWFLLAAILLWDIFAVLAPVGPLNLAMSKAEDYNSDVLRFLMFSTAEDENSHIEPNETTPLISNADEENVQITEHEELKCNGNSDNEPESDKDEDDVRTAEQIEVVLPKPKTAEEALNNSAAHLGMGDFVFYSLLVGKAATSGSIMATMAAAIGVVVGVVLTLTVLNNSDTTMPALPVSIFLGITLHFGTLFIAEPFFQSLFFLLI